MTASVPSHTEPLFISKRLRVSLEPLPSCTAEAKLSNALVMLKGKRAGLNPVTFWGPVSNVNSLGTRKPGPTPITPTLPTIAVGKVNIWSAATAI